jgi:hypothetical protein
VEVELRRPGVGLALERVLGDDAISFFSSSSSSTRRRAAATASVEHASERGFVFGCRGAHGKGRARLFLCVLVNARFKKWTRLREKERERERKRERRSRAS